MVSTLPKSNFNFSFTFILLSVNAFNLNQSKNLSFGRRLTQVLDLLKLKVIADNNLNIAQLMGLVPKRIQNILRKGTNFLHFPQCFQKPPFSGLIKVRIVWSRVKHGTAW